MPPPTRVLAFGGHPVILGVVRLACDSSPSLNLVGETHDVAAVVPLAEETHPDVVVLDIDLGDVDPVLLILDVRDAAPSASVLALSDRSDGINVLNTMRAGAAGYVVKADGLASVGEAIRRVAAGESVIGPELEHAAVLELGRFARQAREGAEIVSQLTSREREILASLADGATTKQIARRLGISPRTVETHIAKLYRKLGVRTRVQAVARAASLGIIRLD